LSLELTRKGRDLGDRKFDSPAFSWVAWRKRASKTGFAGGLAKAGATLFPLRGNAGGCGL
jgi:hypothetical protein